MPDSSGSNLSELSSRASSLLSGSRLKAIYTDGACSGNPGPGGWGVVVQLSNGQVQELGGSAAQTTNNRMELQAAIEALKYVAAVPGLAAGGCVYTDSEYVKNGITKWLLNWKKRGWKTSQGKPVLNQDLWEVLDGLNPTRLEWQYIKAHAGHPGNERADAIARAFSLKQSPRLANLGETVVDPASSEMQSSSDSDSAPSPHSKSSLMRASEVIKSEVIKQDERVGQGESVVPLGCLVQSLQQADLIAQEQFLITSPELAALMGREVSDILERGGEWLWRNWRVFRVREEEKQTLWQLERVHGATRSFGSE